MEKQSFLLLLHCDGDDTQSRDGLMDYLVVVGTGSGREQMGGEPRSWLTTRPTGDLDVRR